MSSDVKGLRSARGQTADPMMMEPVPTWVRLRQVSAKLAVLGLELRKLGPQFGREAGAAQDVAGMVWKRCLEVRTDEEADEWNDRR